MQKKKWKAAMVCCVFLVLGMGGCGKREVENSSETQQTQVAQEKSEGITEEAETKERQEKVEIGAVPYFDCN